MEKHFIVEGALCRCKHGSSIDRLKILTQNKYFANRLGKRKLLASNKELGETFENNSFGTCSLRSNSSCIVHVTAWKGSHKMLKLKQNEGEVLLEGCKACCLTGEEDCIEILNHGQILELKESTFGKEESFLLEQANSLIDLSEDKKEKEKIRLKTIAKEKKEQEVLWNDKPDEKYIDLSRSENKSTKPPERIKIEIRSIFFINLEEGELIDKENLEAENSGAPFILDFDSIKDFRAEEIWINLRVIGLKSPKNQELRWLITDDCGNLLDANDYTGGEYAELLLRRSNAGNKEHSKTYQISIAQLTNTKMPAYQRTHLSEKPEWEEVYKISFELICSPRIIDAYWNNKEKEIIVISKEEEAFIFFETEGLLNHPFKVKIYTLKTSFDEDLEEIVLEEEVISSGPISFKGEASQYYYFRIEDSSKVYFDSKDSNLGGKLYISEDTNFEVYDLPGVVVLGGRDEFFTQYYEACRYTAIILEDSKKTKKEFIFEENRLLNNDKYETLYFLDHIDHTITLQDLDTDECSLPLLPDENDIIHPAHKGIEIDETQLVENEINYTYNKSSLQLKGSYPYKKDLNAIQFILYYIIYKPKPLTLDLLFDTCRYTHDLKINIYPKVEWAFHFFYGEPKDVKKIFYKEREIELTKGLGEWFDDMKAFINKDNFKMIFFNLSYTLDLILSYIKKKAKPFSLGFHLYYDFEDDENYKLIDLGKTNPMLIRVPIYYLTSAAIAIDFIILYLTYGNFEGSTKRLQDGVKKVENKKKKIKQFLDDNNLKITYPQISFYIGQSHEIEDNGELYLANEISIQASPLFEITYDKTWKFDKFLELSREISNDNHINDYSAIRGKIFNEFINIMNDSLTMLTSSLSSIIGFKTHLKLFIKGSFSLGAKFKAMSNEKGEKIFLYNGEKVSEIVLNGGNGIEVILSFEAKLTKEIKFSMFNKVFYAKAETGAKGEIKGGLFFERIYSFPSIDAYPRFYNDLENKEESEGELQAIPVYKDNVVFGGLIGKIIAYMEVVRNKKREYKKLGKKNKITGEIEDYTVQFFPPRIYSTNYIPVY